MHSTDLPWHNLFSLFSQCLHSLKLCEKRSTNFLSILEIRNSCSPQARSLLSPCCLHQSYIPLPVFVEDIRLTSAKRIKIKYGWKETFEAHMCTYHNIIFRSDYYFANFLIFSWGGFVLFFLAAIIASDRYFFYCLTLFHSWRSLGISETFIEYDVHIKVHFIFAKFWIL